MKRAILNEALSRRPNNPLYHYTGQTGLLGIIREKQIWATHTPYLNGFPKLTFGKHTFWPLRISRCNSGSDIFYKRFHRDCKSTSSGLPEKATEEKSAIRAPLPETGTNYIRRVPRSSKQWLVQPSTFMIELVGRSLGE